MSTYNFSLTDLDSDMFSRGYFLHEDVCRFCWTRDATIDIYPTITNEKNQQEKSFEDKILDCLNIDVGTLSHPKRVCDSCANHIVTFYSFKKFCTESNRKLNKLFENRIMSFDITVKVEDAPNENSLEESVTENENCTNKLVPNDKTKSVQHPILVQNSPNLSQNEILDDMTSVSLVGEKDSTSNEDCIVEIENVHEQIFSNDVGELQNDENLKMKGNAVTVEQEMDSLDRLLSKIHGEYTSDCEIVAEEITKEKKTKKVRTSRKQAESMNKLQGDNVKIETTNGEYTSDCVIISEEISSIDIVMKKLRTKRVHSKDSKINNLKIVTNSLDRPKRRSKYEETKPNELKEFCKICSADFRNIRELAKHNCKVHKIKDNGKHYVCYGCDKTFETKKRRFNHEIRYCKGVKNGYKCPKCETHLQFRKMLERHMAHHKTKNGNSLPQNLFRCKSCDKSFKTMEKLRIHQTIIHPLKKYVCETCGRVFTRPDYLYKHRLTHTDTRDHRCPHCPYTTVQRSSLVIHIRTHTDDRPYACEVCPQRCRTKSNLNSHKRRHDQLPCHKCHLCQKTYAQRSSLVDHLSDCHKYNYTCHHCDATYYRKDSLSRHIRIKHRVKRPVKMQLDEGLFKINLPSILQNIDYGEFSKFEEGFNEKIAFKSD